MSALAPLGVDARLRLLALIGIDVYVRREIKGSGSFTVARQQGNQTLPSLNQPDPFTAARLLQVECDLSEAGAQPMSGPYAPLLRHVLQAIGVEANEVRFVGTGAGATTPAMRLSIGANAVQVPTLAQLRMSGAAKRSLWTALRTLRRVLASP